MIKNEKSKSNFYSTNPNLLSQQYLSTVATDTTGNKKEILEKKSKKELNNINFIKQKNKFYISNFFNEKETKKFLESKDIALKRIILNEEIENNNYNLDIINNNLQFQKNEIKKKKDLKQQNQEESTNIPMNKKIKNKNDKNDKNKILNENKNEINKNNDKSSDSEFNFNIIETVNNCENDSKDKDYIYRFIIDNADESEDNLHKKLKKEIKRVETKKNNINNKNINNSGRAQAINKKNEKNNIKVNTSEKSEKKMSPFDYSEINRNLMVGNEIEVSSIGDDGSKSPERNQTRMLTTLEDKKEDTNNNLNIKSDCNNQISINSAHESLMSILSGLI